VLDPPSAPNVVFAGTTVNEHDGDGWVVFFEHATASSRTVPDAYSSLVRVSFAITAAAEDFFFGCRFYSGNYTGRLVYITVESVDAPY
jgi:hypothetical protein